MRMFVAVRPAPYVVEALDHFLEPRRDTDDALRWTDPYQWHVTLAFYPSVPERKLEDLLEALHGAAARRSALTARLEGAGAFPAPDRARVLWFRAASRPAAGLEVLAEGSRAAATKVGVEVEGGRFRSHLTVARLRQPVDATRWLRVLETFEGQEWQVASYDLIQSHLGEGRENRPRYELHGSFSLGDKAQA